MQNGSLIFLATRRLAAFAIAAMALVFVLSGTAKADPETYVIGGTNVSHSQYTTNYPFMVGLLPDNDPNHQFCAGTLVASKWVLTAAHCWAEDEGLVPKYIFIGSEDLLNGGLIVPVTGHYIHPSWNPDLVQNDIMLLKLGAVAPGTPATRATPADDPSAGDMATLLGWGLTSAGPGAQLAQILQKAQIDIINQNSCKSDWVAGQAIVTDNQICAIHYGSSGSDVPRDSCNGDSGGPLLYGGKLIGIVSFGLAGCYPQLPSVYTRVSSYGGWIDGAMSKVLSVTSGSTSFGAADTEGQTVERTLQLRSDGDDPITISGAYGGGDFAVKSTTCGGTLSPGATCSVTVSFDPSKPGKRTGTLSLATDSSAYPIFPVALNGLGSGNLNLPVSLKLLQPLAAKSKKGVITADFHVSFFAPVGLEVADVCAGTLTVSLLIPSSKPVFKKASMKWVGSGCVARFSAKMARSALRRKAKAAIKFSGNGFVAPTSVLRSFRVR